MTQVSTDPGFGPQASAPVAAAAPPASPASLAAGVQPPAEAQPHWIDRIPREFGGDWSGALGAGKRHRVDGWEEAAEKLGITGHQLLTAAQKNPDLFRSFLTGEGLPTADQPPAEATAFDPNLYGAPPQPTGAPYWDQYLGQWIQPAPQAPDPLEEMRKQLQKTQQELADWRNETTSAKRQSEIDDQIANAERLEEEAIAKHMKALGFEPKPQKMDFLGKVREIDPMHRWAEGGLRRMAEDQYAEFIDQLPKDDVRRRLAPPPEMYEQAAEAMRPFLTVQSDVAVDNEVKRQQGMPQGAPPESPGGRPQQAPGEMNRSDRNAAMLREVKAEGGARGVPDE